MGYARARVLPLHAGEHQSVARGDAADDGHRAAVWFPPPHLFLSVDVRRAGGLRAGWAAARPGT